ncbi:MAG: 30S ribosomal protein S24e [Candidatus Thermoplasmatota archaeon]|nr:30S ribosomal protein S24e [Candidatus Thermoplasmatota archaeon]
MEIEIQSKTDNLLLGRIEVRFVIRHEGEGTPKRELVRTELAEKLNAKKENIMVSFMHSHFGARTTVGYAKIYGSVEAAKAGEVDYVLKRNGLGTKKKAKKEAKKEGGEKKEAPAAPKEKPQKAESKEKPAEKPKVEQPAEKAKPEKSVEAKKE